jgi:filamentous hemagglutinin
VALRFGAAYCISTKQNLLTADGLGKGLSEGLAGIGLSTLDSFSEAMKHPMDTYAALTDLYKTTSFQQALGAASGEFKANLDKLGEDLEIGGDDKAEDLGYRFGKALATAVALIAAPQGDAAMGAKALADLGVTVSSKAYTALRAKVVVEDVGDIPVVGAKGGGSSGFSGGKPTIVDDPYSPNAVTERSSVNRDYYGRENAADEFSAGLPDYATHSTAKSYQSTAPRDLNEQTLWNRVTENPSAGRDTKLAGDKDFPRSEGWRKMEVSHRLPSGENITIHYQYNSVTGKAYDMKITTPQQLPPVLQPGRTIE